MISFKLSIHDTTKNGEINFKDWAAWSKPPPKRAVPVKIRAYIYQCKDLPAADSNGTSDPFIKVWDMSEGQKQTQIIEDSTNPLYYEVLELDYEVRDINDLESYPPFIFDVYDYDDDLFDSSNDYLARAIIEPEDCAIVLEKDFKTCTEHGQDRCNYCRDERALKEIPLTPRWHPLKFSVDSPTSGEVLVSFSVSQLEY